MGYGQEIYASCPPILLLLLAGLADNGDRSLGELAGEGGLDGGGARN